MTGFKGFPPCPVQLSCSHCPVRLTVSYQWLADTLKDIPNGQPITYVCYGCHELSLVTVQLESRKPTPSEEAELETNPAIRTLRDGLSPT